MVYNVIVDSRPGENDLFAMLGSMVSSDQATLERRQLDIGDVIVECDAGSVMIERKTWADWVSSLNDGRYKSQKVRMLAERARRAAESPDKFFSFIYLVQEPYIQAWEGRTFKAQNMPAFCAVIKTNIRDNVPMIQFRDTRDMSMAIMYIGRTLVTNGFQSDKKTDAGGDQSKFTIHAKKRKNVEENQFLVMMSSIPGLSERKASAVVETFDTMANLITHYQKAIEGGAKGKELDNLLQDIMINEKERLGPALSLKIKTSLGF